MHERLWRGFSEEEKSQAMRLLRRMADNLAAANSSGPDDAGDDEDGAERKQSSERGEQA